MLKECDVQEIKRPITAGATEEFKLTNCIKFAIENDGGNSVFVNWERDSSTQNVEIANGESAVYELPVGYKFRRDLHLYAASANTGVIVRKFVAME